MMNSLCVGTKLMTVGGMVGKITQVNSDNTLIINVGTETNPTLIVIDKKAVGYVLEKVAAPAAEAPATEEPAAEETATDAVTDATEETAPATEETEAPAEEGTVTEDENK